MPGDLVLLQNNTARIPVNLVPLVDNGTFRTIQNAVPNSAVGMSLQFMLFNHSGGYIRSISVRPNASSAYEWRHEGLGMYTLLVPPSGNSILITNTMVQGYFQGAGASILPFRGPIVTIVPSNIVQQVRTGEQDTFARVGAPTGASVSADIAGVQATATTIDARVATMGTAVTGIRTVVDAVNQNTDTELTTLQGYSNTLETRVATMGGAVTGVRTVVDAINQATDTEITTLQGYANTIETRVATMGGAVTGVRTVVDQINVAVDTEVAAILADTDELQQRWANGGALANSMAALAGSALGNSIHALAHSTRAHLTVLLDTARGEPGQGAPPASAIPMLKLDYLYKLTRNKLVTNNSIIEVYADDATTVDHKATHSDAADTYTRGEFGSGP